MHNHRGVGALSRQRLHCNHMLPGIRWVQCLEHLLRCLPQACRAIPREAIHHHICTAPAPLLLLRQYRGADNCLVNSAGGLLSGHGRAWLLLPCPAGDERSQFTLGALWLRCPLHCALGWGLY